MEIPPRPSTNFMNFSKLIEISRALYTPKHEVRTFHVSFLLYKSRILSIGINSLKTTPINILNNKYFRTNNGIIHNKGICSEWASLNKLKNTSNIRFNKLSLINVRIGRDGLIKNSKPCSFCESLCQFFNIKEIYFTNDKGEFEKYS